MSEGSEPIYIIYKYQVEKKVWLNLDLFSAAQTLLIATTTILKRENIFYPSYGNFGISGMFVLVQIS